ncbi:hypothetical protein GCM10007859_14400 [Brevundimonas denitrificans]|uniref:AMIN domain-containing protein n=1 Tax=Brevundimonas denitrificans TaxID=1443434 RepID=A0ABQ6BJF9_9CAUL|nr:DUF6702 family protein [Brevundimonas denitrificans]GLS01426.1 hypothetical protein GCM10007859_14400 [Brevundimonas denitrificans]
MRRVLLAAALVAALATPVSAHRGHAGLTVIEIDPASGSVSVVHRFSAHDVEPALVSIAPEAQPSLDDPRAVAELETHLRQRFRLDIDGAAIPVTHAATDLAGDNIRVEFAGETSDHSIAAVTVDLDFFPGVHDDQEQQVNVRINGVTRTVVFRPGSAAQTVTFAG